MVYYVRHWLRGKMIYSKQIRRRSARPRQRSGILPGFYCNRLFTSPSILLVVVLMSAMGLLLSTHYKTDMSNCSCPSVTGREVNDEPEGGRSGVEASHHTMKKHTVQTPLKSSAGTSPHVTGHFVGSTYAPSKFHPKWWKNHTRTVCKQLGFSTNQSSLQPAMLSKVLVDDNHKILYCQIAKVASTNLGKIFAIIAGIFNGTNPDAIDSSDIHWKYNKLQSHLDSFPVDLIINKIKHYFKFVFVRDPFERLLSGYRNKFLKPSTSYFAYLNRKLVLKYRTNNTQSGGVTFPEFVAYLVDPERKAPMNGHWQPMHELCRPCETNYDFIGKISSFGEDVSHILEVNNLTKILQLPKQSSSHSFHKTDLYLEQYYSQVPKALLLSLYKVYHPDYVIFDFQVPKVILDLMK